MEAVSTLDKSEEMEIDEVDSLPRDDPERSDDVSEGVQELDSIPAEVTLFDPAEAGGKDVLETRISGLQPLEPFVKEKRWTLYEGGEVIGLAPFNGKWTVDDRGLVRRNGKVFIPNYPSLRAEILRVNHDDPWDRGHFGQARTFEVINRCYWWP